MTIIGIGLTTICCLAALGFWGRTFQIIGVIALGFTCVYADLNAHSEK